MSEFSREFLETMRWRPMQALEALYWYTTGRRVRALNRLRHGWHTAPDAFARWTRRVERNQFHAAQLARESAAWPFRPTISLAIDALGSTPEQIAATIASVASQAYVEWEILVCGTAAPADFPADPRIRHLALPAGSTVVEHALAAATGSHFVPLMPGAILAEPAMLRWAKAIVESPDLSVAYGDEDRIEAGGVRSSPWLKPDWQRDLLLAQDYVSGCCMIAVAPARRWLPLDNVRKRDPIYALLLELTKDPTARVVRLPHILCHRPEFQPEEKQNERVAILRRHLGSTCEGVEPSRFGSHRVVWPLPRAAPLVSIIVPTRDRADLLQACISSILAKTTWPSYEILIVDNNSKEPETFACLARYADHPAISVLTDPRPYNYSEINNQAIASARGAYVCLLNNDTEVISPEWMEELMRQALRPHVGAVGAKLLYPDGSIQHAGVVVGMGDAAGHAHRTLPDEDAGYFAQAHVAREATAVTAACLVIEKCKLLAVGGLDELHLGIAYNDVDLCLKLRKAGWTNMYVPSARLFHHESVSRGNDLSPQHNERYMAELKTLRARWKTAEFVDPLHHPMLDRTTDQYFLAYRTDAPQ